MHTAFFINQLAPAERLRRTRPLLMGLLLVIISLIGPMIAKIDRPAVALANPFCPLDAIEINSNASIQEAAERADFGAKFCLKSGVYRQQMIRPKSGQQFYGADKTVLNGSRLVTSFISDDRFWTFIAPAQRRPRAGAHRGVCATNAPTCDLPQGLFIDDQALEQVEVKNDLKQGRFYIDHANGRIYLADNPTGHKVEFTDAAYAFGGQASNILIKNMIVEKYASIPQEGAIQAQQTVGWTVENCELRLNSAAGIAVGSGTRVRDCNIHHNGQIGITGAGRKILIEGNSIWMNNVRQFDYGWEAGGVKVALGDNIILRGNHVSMNIGPGLWCDGDCRNVLYEHNLIENNVGAGIYHEIAFNATIRNNVLRHNAVRQRGWFWASEIIIAGSQDVEIYDNKLVVARDRCGIMLIDQGRNDHVGHSLGPLYKTQNNNVHDNDLIFVNEVCSGGASDIDDQTSDNFAIITDGNNRFDGNKYLVHGDKIYGRFPWGHNVLFWDEWRAHGLDPRGQLIGY